MGGFGKVETEVKRFLRDYKQGNAGFADLTIVVRDANCKGFNDRKALFDKIVKEVGFPTENIIYAIPDPHVERWMLLDADAFHQVFDVGCALPDQKCDKNRYKVVLLEQIREGELDPPLGGMEYADNIVAFLNIEVANRDDSFSKFYHSATQKFRFWSLRV